MNRRLRVAALPLLLLLAAGTAPSPAADQEIPPAPPRAPLPPEPKDAGRKAIQALLKRWFENEPRIPVKGKSEAEVKGERAKVVGELETEIQKWPNCLRLVAWWKTRLEETQPSANKPTVINPKEEFVFGDGDKRKTYTFAISVPKSYRGNGTDLLPVIITVIDKGADPKKLFPEIYGKLLDTHIVVASYENNVPNAGVLLNAIYYAYLTYRCDRDRFTLDGLGKGARFVEELAASEYAALQWNGVVIRSPLAVQPLEGNLALFPVAVVEPAAPVAAALRTVVDAHVKAGGGGTLVPNGDLAAIQAFIAGLPPRKAGDQSKPYEAWFKSSGRMPKWGLWFLVNVALDNENNQPVRVAISRDPAFNVVDIDASNLAEGTLLLNDEVLDLDQPVYVRVNGIVVAKEKVVRSFKHTFDWSGGYATLMLGPRNYLVTAVLPFVVPEGDARIPKADRDAAAAAEKAAADKAEADRKKQDDLDRQAAEAAAAQKKAEEDAKNAKPENPPVPAPGGVEPVPAPELATEYFTSLEDAKAKGRGRPILVVFKAARDDARQQALDVTLLSEDAKKALASFDIVTLKPAEEGDAGKPTRDLLATLSGAADATAPFLAVVDRKGTLALAGIKEGEVQAAVLKFLAGLTTVDAEKARLQWPGDYQDSLKQARASGSPIAVLFAGAADAKGQKELEEALANDKECLASLGKLICVRLDTQGEAGAKNLELQKTLDPSRTPPILCVVLRTADDKGAEVLKPHDVVDPVNLLAEKETFLAKLRAQLAKAAEQKGTTVPAPPK